MFRFILLLSFIALFAASMPAAAKNSPSDSFELGVEVYNYRYTEKNFATLEGVTYGLNGTYTYRFSDRLFLKADATVDVGDLDYSSNGTGRNNGVTAITQDYRGLFGKEFKLSRHSTISPYVGLGYRLLFDGGGAQLTSTGNLSYDRRSEYLYVPIGATFDFKLGDWSIRPNAEFDYLIQGWQTSYLRDIGFDSNLTNSQQHGYGVRGNIMFAPPVDFYHLTVGPFVRYWNVDNSKTAPLSINSVPAGYGVEPANTTVEAGINARIQF